jgi:hypothetical protein
MPVNAKIKLDKIIKELEEINPLDLNKQHLDKIIIEKAGVMSILGKKDYIDALIALNVLEKRGKFFHYLKHRKELTLEEKINKKKDFVKDFENRIKKIKNEIEELEREKK